MVAPEIRDRPQESRHSANGSSFRLPVQFAQAERRQQQAGNFIAKENHPGNPSSGIHNKRSHKEVKRLKSDAITLFKEDVLSLGELVARTVSEMARLLRKESGASLELIEGQEKQIDQLYRDVEERCLDLLLEKDVLAAKAIRTLVGGVVIAGKLERMADHANRVARIASWAKEDDIEVPAELPEMAETIHKMMQDVLLSFLTEGSDKIQAILHRDNEIDYLDAVLSKKLLADLGSQDAATAHMTAQFLFCTRFLERMGDLCTSVAKRTYFIITGTRVNPAAKNNV